MSNKKSCSRPILHLVLLCSILFLIGCVSEKDVYGCWGKGGINDPLNIITPDYKLSFSPGSTSGSFAWISQKNSATKSNYQLKKRWNGIWISGYGNQVMRSFLWFKYLDATGYYYGIPIGEFYFQKRLTEKEVFNYFRQRGITSEEVRHLPIFDKSTPEFNLIPDNSVPEILLKYEKLEKSKTEPK